MSISRRLQTFGLAVCLTVAFAGMAAAQAPAPATPNEAPAAPKDAPNGIVPAPATPKEAPAAPKGAPSGTTPEPATPKQPPSVPKNAPGGTSSAPATPQPKPQAPTPGTPPGRELAPPGTPQTQEFEPNNSPTTPRLTTTETVEVPARPIAMVKGTASFDDAFQAIKTALDKAKAALAKAGLTQTGHPLAIVTDTDEKGLKFEAALPIAKPDPGKADLGKSDLGKSDLGKSDLGKSDLGQSDLGDGVTIGESPAGRALKFRHIGPYDEIDRTYATITSYLDNRGLEASSPFIEEYPDDLKSEDDPKLTVDIYIFLKK